MSDLAIELHDVGLLVASAEGPVGEPSPGLALIDGDRLHYGTAAEGRARLRPKQAHRRFWHELSTEPLPAAFPEGWSVADLAHGHLESLWRDVGSGVERVFIAASGAWTSARVGLALGIAKALGLPVAGVVDSALAAVVGLEPKVLRSRHVVHLDLMQHQAVASRLAWHDGEWRRTRVTAADSVGRASLLDTWARTINAAFVRATRFEPFHAPESEQDLYDRLPGWLAELDRRSTVEASLDAPQGPVHVELDRASLLDAVTEAYRQLAALVTAHDGATVLLSASCAALPGFADSLEQSGRPVRRLDRSASVEGALVAADRLIQDDGQLRFVLRLAADDPAPVGTDTPSIAVPDTAPEPEPMRLHLEGRGEVVLVTAVDGAVRRADQPLRAGSPLAIGDRLELPSGMVLRVEQAAGRDGAAAEDEDRGP